MSNAFLIIRTLRNFEVWLNFRSVAKLTNALLHLLGKFLLVVCHVPQNFLNQTRDFGKLVNGCGPGGVMRHHLKGEGKKGPGEGGKETEGEREG